jgi:hypothetical protein
MNADSAATARVQVRSVGRNTAPDNGAVRADGGFALIDYASILRSPPIAERIFTLGRIPSGYDVKSVTYQGKDVLQTPLPTPSPSALTEEFRIVLTARRSGLYSVSGRAVGLPLDGTPVRLETAPGTASQDVLVRIAEARVSNDGAFTLQGVPPGSYVLRLQGNAGARVDVVDHDVTGVELTRYQLSEKQLAAQKERATSLIQTFSSVQSRGQYQGRSMETIVKERTGADVVDCGKFAMLGSQAGALSAVPTLEAALECVRSSLNQRRPFIALTVSSGIDSSDTVGLAGDAKGTLYQFFFCVGMCGAMVVQPCPPETIALIKDGALTCDLPPRALTRWPVPNKP